jgi:hypothetical protein
MQDITVVPESPWELQETLAMLPAALLAIGRRA